MVWFTFRFFKETRDAKRYAIVLMVLCQSDTGSFFYHAARACTGGVLAHEKERNSTAVVADFSMASWSGFEMDTSPVKTLVR